MVKYYEYILIINTLLAKNLKTDIVLRWRLIIEYYGPDIEYIKVDKNIVADALSRFTLNGNKCNTHNSTYKRKIVSEINDNEKYLKISFLLI